MQTQRPGLKRLVTDPIIAILTAVIFIVFRVLPFKYASGLGGYLARKIGPKLKLHSLALKNLKSAFPHKPISEITSIAKDMWDNLGRVAGEYPHLPSININADRGIVEVVGIEHVELLRDDNEPGIFFSGHIGNWEIVSLGATQYGLPLDRVYRAANNRMLEWVFRLGRRSITGELIPKGSIGARQLLKSLYLKRHLGMMADQKMNDGIPIPFFGRDAMTAPGLAEMAVRYKCPVVGARVRRYPGPRFKLIIDPPLNFTPSGDRHRDVKSIMTMINVRLEEWIREAPEQWLWVHNRWPD
ncbi:MAG: hypothetical protein CBB68_02360 [Rhodospirillaceae bacterium TMED8]|nr:lauroyl acyltransferase [Magnetovibrio sp.]OUT52218.1 MAG: hypothetical protein CBB68_02360 [Rhodospirillaceae bacterium TMED8]